MPEPKRKPYIDITPVRLTKAETARLLNMDTKTVMRRVAAGGFPKPHRDGTRLYWFRADIEKHLQSLAQAPATIAAAA